MPNPNTTVCITGASSGIGAALALAYAKPTTHLLLLARNPQRLHDIATRCQQQGASVEYNCIDITDKANMTEWLQQQDDISPIDIIIANAGCSTTQLQSHYHSNHDIEQACWNIHLQGTLNTLHPLLPRMQQRRRGHIALMSSMNAFIATAQSPCYGAAKAALLHYGRALRGKLYRDNIHVSVMCPGWVDSPLTDKNTFAMPLKMTAHRAARIIQRGIKKNTAVIAFPKRLRLITVLYAILPERLKSAVTQRL